MTRVRLLAVGALVAPALLLLGCSGEPSAEATSAPDTTPVATSPAPEPAATPSQSPASAPTCDNIIPEDTVADFADVGWTAKAESFRAGGIELEGGVQCTWGDYSVATDHVQIFGWASIDEAQTDEAIGELLASGWKREDTDDGTYVTESADTAIATDDEGYGLTYLFGDGYVELADTKQGLLLVEWPPA